MTKSKQNPTRTQAMLLTVLLIVFLSLSPFFPMQATGKDSLCTFRFVPKRGMFHIHYKENGEELARLLILVHQHREDILAGNVHVFVNGFCKSASTDKENLRLARERSNRVKTEMILRSGLREECFHTTNVPESYGELRNTVIVRISLPEDTTTVNPDNDQSKVELGDAQVEVYSSKVELDTIKADFNNYYSEQNEKFSFPSSVASSSVRGWSIGLNIGIPFFWGDMLSISADKTYIGIATGIQSSYRFSEFLGISLSVDYAQGKTGARDYARNYQLAPSCMTLYDNGTDTSLPYGELYSKISVVNTGLGLNIYLNRFFGSRAVDSHFQAVLAPTIYGQLFNADIYNKVDNTKYSDGTTKPNTISFGLGGSISLHYRIAPTWILQLKNSLLWITDNNFDGIATPYSRTRENAMWMPQVGVLWKFY